MAVSNYNFFFACILFCVIAVWRTQGKLTCPDGWTMYEKESKCIRMFNNPVPWDGARTSCKRYGGDLIRVDSSDKTVFLESWHKRNRAMAWIGLKRGYSGSLYFYWLDDNTYARYTYWFGGEPNGVNSNEDCVTLVGWNVRWNDFICTEKESYICETDAYHSPPAVCPANWILYGKNCFRLYHDEQNWDDARKNCKSVNADLAIIPDEDTNNFLAKKIFYNDQANIYLGATDTTKEGVFQWIDPSVPFIYQNWYPDQPNNYLDQDCLHVWKDKLPHWADSACTDKMHYLCQQPAISYPLICPTGWFQYSEYCFKSYKTPKSWTDAREFCRAQSGRLATIPDNPTKDVITYAFVSDDKTSVWIGLNDIDKENSWTWVDSKDSSNYTYWADYQPNNLKGDQDCVAIWEKNLQRWVVDHCTTSHPFICETSATRSPYACPPGWSLYNNYCFKLHQTLTNWTDARDFCRAEQSHLAAIPDLSTQYFLENEFFSQDANHIWLGLNDIDKEDTYTWVDTSFTIKDYKNWERDQPNNYKNQDCVSIYGDHGNKWADMGCWMEFHFLCQKQAGKAGATMPTPGTSKPTTTSTTTPSTTTTSTTTSASSGRRTPDNPIGGNTPSQQKSSNSKKSGLSSGGVAGIVIAVIIIVAAVGVVNYFMRKRMANPSTSSTTGGFDNATYDASRNANDTSA